MQSTNELSIQKHGLICEFQAHLEDHFAGLLGLDPSGVDNYLPLAYNH